MEQSTSINPAEAAERRQRESSQRRSLVDERAEHEKRQHFRRLVDPGIMRPNAAPQALESLKTIQKLCQNIVDNPDNEKYQKIKSTNSKIEKDIISPKGTVELLPWFPTRSESSIYIQGLEHRRNTSTSKVEEFQPYYKFNPAHMKDLQIGSKIIGETLQIHIEKEERAASARRLEKEARAQAAEKVKLAFMDDRRAKSELDEREKELREARVAAAARRSEGGTQPQQQSQAEDDEGPDNQTSVSVPGPGRTLGGSPPPYTDRNEDD
ncbi:hypothetical protein PM082_005488 [Marasmius tenuissimus]|nr:hypothetical protein PM082_005488 [Marasmius tenuissimus]